MSRSLPVTLLVSVFALGLVALGLLVAVSSVPESSVELGVTALSPLGAEGGVVIPASCPSYEHTPGVCNPPTFSGNGQPSSFSINSGSSVTISWSCVSSSSSSGFNFSTGGATSGSASASPTTTTTYTVVCSNGGQGSFTVTVLNPALSISASPTRVREGNASTITWSATNVTSCSVSGPSFSATGASGSQSTGAITQQSTYTLSCVTEGGTVTANTVVNLIPKFEEF